MRELNQPEVVSWYFMGWRVGVIVERGRKHIKVLVLDGKVKIKRVPLADERDMKPLDEPVKKALKHFREAYRTFNRVPIVEDIGGFKTIAGYRLPRMSQELRQILS